MEEGVEQDVDMTEVENPSTDMWQEESMGWKERRVAS